MPVNKEFTIRLEDRPGTLGKVCQALADQNVNILAFQQLPLEKGKGAVRLVLDNYGYCGAEPGTNATFVIFGVAEVGKAVKVFEQAAAARPST